MVAQQCNLAIKLQLNQSTAIRFQAQTCSLLKKLSRLVLPLNERIQHYRKIQNDISFCEVFHDFLLCNSGKHYSLALSSRNWFHQMIA